MTTFGYPNAAVPFFSRVVESSSPEDLENRVGEALAELAAISYEFAPGILVPVFVSDIELAGGGDGHTFVVTITASPLVSGLDSGVAPASINVLCYMASEAEALQIARAVSFGRLEGSTDIILGEEVAGASQGTRFMGMAIVGEEDAEEALLNRSFVYPFSATDPVGAATVNIVAPATPVVVAAAFNDSDLAPFFAETAPGSGILEYIGTKSFRATVRTRVAVRSTVAGPTTVSAGAMYPGPAFASLLNGQQSITVANSLFSQVNTEHSRVFFSGLSSPNQRIAIGVENDTSADDLQVISAELIIQPD